MTGVDPGAELGPASVVTPDGWTFEPLEHGAIRITASEFVEPTVIPRDLWAVIVANVSWAGQTEARVEKALRFHYGTDGTPNPAAEGQPASEGSTE